jgi:hypothetical protein
MKQTTAEKLLIQGEAEGYGMTAEMFQQDFNGSFNAEIVVGVILFGILEVCQAQGIDRNLLWFERGKGWGGEYLNLELPIGGFRFGSSAPPKHDFFPLHIDAIVITVFADLGEFDGFGYISLAHNAFLSTGKPQSLRFLG